jgi:hypothetical protein
VQQEPNLYSLNRHGRLDGFQGLDSANEGLALF